MALAASLLGRPEAGGPQELTRAREASLGLLRIEGQAEVAQERGIVPGAPLLTDFGLTRELDPHTSQNLSCTGALIGTPGFCPPEQARGDRELGPAADVYGLGATLYAMLTVRAPFEGESLLGILEATVGTPPTAPSLLRPGVPARLEQLCLRCMAKAPGDRPPSAAAVAAELAGFTGAGLARPSRWRGVGRATAVVLGVALLALLAGSGVRALSGPRTAPRPLAQVLCEQGLSALQRGERDAALEHLQRAVEEDPGYGRAWNGLAVMRELQGDLPGALAAYERALGAELSWPSALYHRALAQAERGDTAAALRDAGTLELREPQGPESAVVRAAVLQREGKFEAAVTELERSLRRRATAEAYAARGQIAIQRGDLRGGLEDLHLALERTPEDDPHRRSTEEAVGRLEELLRGLEAAGFKPPPAKR